MINIDQDLYMLHQEGTDLSLVFPTMSHVWAFSDKNSSSLLNSFYFVLSLNILSGKLFTKLCFGQIYHF